MLILRTSDLDDLPVWLPPFGVVEFRCIIKLSAEALDIGRVPDLTLFAAVDTLAVRGVLAEPLSSRLTIIDVGII